MVEGDIETDSVGFVNTPRHLPNRFDEHGVEDTDDSDTESVVGSMRQEDTVSVVEDPANLPVPRATALRHAFRNINDVDVERMFSLRASVMRSVLRILQGPFQNGIRVTRG